MKIRLWVMAMITLMAFGTAHAAGDDFGGLDRDKNGKLEKAEIEKAAPEVFKKADRSGDGTLDRDEFKAAGGSSARFDQIDADKNGRIDPDEFRQAAIERFKQVDTNRDGRIDTQEWSKLQKPIQNPLIFFYF
jgi:Ca2+-binding EF-hand superfamily protein